MESHPVFIAPGDRLAELEALVQELGGADAAGLHRLMFVTRANQTVAITTRPDSPLADALRGLEGWQEPTDT